MERTLPLPFDAAEAATRDALKTEVAEDAHARMVRVERALRG
jgi:hypothetical protein